MTSSAAAAALSDHSAADPSAPSAAALPSFCCCVMGVSGCGKSTVGAAIARQWTEITGSSSTGSDCSSSDESKHQQQSPVQWIDGDDYHSDSSKSKMAAGIALTDQDRVGWLSTLASLASQSLQRDTSVVLACSALKPQYREMIFGVRKGLAEEPTSTAAAAAELASASASASAAPITSQPTQPAQSAQPPLSPIPRLFLIYLRGSRALLDARLRSRQGHFAKADLLDSQLRTLVEPTDEECRAMRVELCTIDLDAGESPEQQAARAVQFMLQKRQGAMAKQEQQQQ